MNHEGTKIKISKLNEKLDVNEIVEDLEKKLYIMTNPIISKHPMKVIVNGKEIVSKPPEAGKEFSIICTGKNESGIDTTFGEIRGKLSPNNSSSVDIIVKAPVVTTSHTIGPTNPITGYVIADFLDVTTNREDIVRGQNPAYKAFMNSLNSYISSHFPSKTSNIEKRNQKVMRDFAKIMDALFKEDNYTREKFLEQIKKDRLMPVKSVKVKLDSKGTGIWDLMMAGPSIIHGDNIFETSERTLEILDEKEIPYKIVD